jgi:hypothetical protein
MSEINIGASRFANRIPIPNPKEDARHRLFCVVIDHHCSDIKLELNRIQTIFPNDFTNIINRTDGLGKTIYDYYPNIVIN